MTKEVFLVVKKDVGASERRICSSQLDISLAIKSYSGRINRGKGRFLGLNIPSQLFFGVLSSFDTKVRDHYSRPDYSVSRCWVKSLWWSLTLLRRGREHMPLQAYLHQFQFKEGSCPSKGF
jgi:hypothetical protein